MDLSCLQVPAEAVKPPLPVPGVFRLLGPGRGHPRGRPTGPRPCADPEGSGTCLRAHELLIFKDLFEAQPRSRLSVRACLRRRAAFPVSTFPLSFIGGGTSKNLARPHRQDG